jgi:hypothetical protein
MPLSNPRRKQGNKKPGTLARLGGLGISGKLLFQLGYILFGEVSIQSIASADLVILNRNTPDDIRGLFIC